jgi:hypothetical protein
LRLALPAVSFFVHGGLAIRNATLHFGGQLLFQITSIDSVGGLQVRAVFCREVVYCCITPAFSQLQRNKPIVKRRVDVDRLDSAQGIAKPVWGLPAPLSRRILCDATALWQSNLPGVRSP